MSAEKIAQLESEVARQKQLLDVLLNENVLLKSIIAYVKTGEPLPELWKPYVETVIGHPELWKPYDKTHIGQTETGISYVKTDIGQTQVWKPQVETHPGQTEVGKPYDKTHIGHPENFQKDDTSAAEPLPNQIPMLRNNHGALAVHLSKPDFMRVSWDARVAMAALLIHCHNRGDGSYNTLCKVCARSRGGITKLIAALKKRGYLQSTAYQQYRPTEKALACFRKAKWVMEEAKG